MTHYVIIGNGTAAVGCIEGIRSMDQTAPITVVSAEAGPVYSRPLISYLLEGKTDTERMLYRAPSFYEDNGCTLLSGVRAERIDPTKKKVYLNDGKPLPYTALCVATGSRPFVPPMEGLEEVVNKFSFMTLSDALALKKAITKESRVLIVGAGLIGLKCAEGIRDRVKSITVCDLADRVLSSILDADCAGVVQKHLEKNGLRFLLGDSVKLFTKNSAKMNSGKTVPFDILVLAVGVRANAELVRELGAQVDRGIVVYDTMETDVTGIWAAGDCAQGYDASADVKRVLAILPNAYLQGHTAGVNMAGGNAALKNAIPLNSVGFFGLHLMTAGSYVGEMIEKKDEGTLRRFFVQDGLLRGFILVGSVERAGIYTSLVREKTPLSTLNFDLMKKVASNMIFSREVRKERFGGETR